MKRILFILSFISFSYISHAQKNKIEGKITDASNGNSVSGVSVIIKETGKGVSSDLDGRFILNAEAGKKYTIILSSTNYETKEISEVETGVDGIAHIDIVLKLKAKMGEEIVLRTTTSAKKETVNAMISFQKNTNTVASVISAESIRRSPDRNTGEVLKRTPGASLIDGKFLVVRGLADRYNQAMINGILLTSTEPDRKTFSFDIIPAQMIDNIIINKAFVPELPGEWAGGLIQVNTKDIPTKNFFNIQIGSGFNTQTINRDFYKAKGGSTDWLGIDDGTRALGAGYTIKSNFTLATQAEKNQIGKSLNNDWSAKPQSVTPNASFQASGGFTGKVFGKNVGGILGVNYTKNLRYTDITNRFQSLTNGRFTEEFNYEDERYTTETALGGIASLSVQLNTANKISAKAIVNVNTNNYAIRRSGSDNNTREDVQGGELVFKQNTFLTTQLSGEHNIVPKLKLKWYGAFNILDGYSPDQRRFQYRRPIGSQNNYQFLVGSTRAQESGSRVFQSLSDYIYTAGGDAAYNFTLLDKKQTIKIGYMLQVKDRLFDAQLFANFLERDNAALRELPIDQIFAPANFGDGSSTSRLFSFSSINNRDFRYMANTILNAGFIQFDNQLTNKLRIVWGVRVEDFDQLLGSVKSWDPRFKNTKQTDFLPGVNATYKLNTKTNLRVSGSQTVIRPELRELANLTLYDFELNSAVQGNSELVRNKVTNVDLRYEFYPRSGEVFTAGVFYKYFQNPVEQILLQGGQIFTYINPEKATAYGVEVELRKKLDMVDAFKNFTVQANAAYIKSTVTDSKRNIDRPLQGQSPYLINVGLLYDLEKAGLNATLLFNQIGQRIYLVGDVDASGGDGIPNIWEAPRPILDLQIGKKIIQKRGEIRLNISDILNQTQYFYQNADNKTSFQKNKDAYRFTRKYGSTVSVTFNYSF